MGKRGKIGTVNGGVYVVFGRDNKVWVGEAVDCYLRNAQLTRLGIRWKIVRAMVDSTPPERIKVETETAGEWFCKGWQVVSTHHGLNRSHSVATRSKIGAALSGRKRKDLGPRWRKRISNALKGRVVSPEILARRIGKKRTPETRAKMRAAALRREERRRTQ